MYCAHKKTFAKENENRLRTNEFCEKKQTMINDDTPMGYNILPIEVEHMAIF